MPSAVITVGLQEASYSVSEAEGVFSVCAVLSGQTERNVSVELSISQLPGTTAQGLVIIIFSITAGNNTMNAGVCIYYKLKLDTNVNALTVTRCESADRYIQQPFSI